MVNKAAVVAYIINGQKEIKTLEHSATIKLLTSCE